MKKQWVFAGVAILFSSLMAVASDVPLKFNYQGVLKTGMGDAVNNANKVVTFKLYTVATGGSAVWGRDIAIYTDAQGLFNVELSDDIGTQWGGLSNSLISVLSAYDALYLELTVEGSAILPRQQLLSVPYAMMAGNVKNATAGFTVTGDLTVTDGANIQSLTVETDATVKGNLTVDKSAHVREALTVDHELSVGRELTAYSPAVLHGAVTMMNTAVVGGQLTAKNGLKITGDVTVAGGKPFMFKTFNCNGIGTLSSPRVYETGVISAGWYACVVGFSFGAGDIDENNRHHLPEALMVESDGTWKIHVSGLALDHSEKANVIVKALFIRTELTYELPSHTF